MWGKILTVDKVKTALDLLLSQQLLINISFFCSNRGALITEDKENICLIFILYTAFVPGHIVFTASRLFFQILHITL